MISNDPDKLDTFNWKSFSNEKLDKKLKSLDSRFYTYLDQNTYLNKKNVECVHIYDEFWEIVRERLSVIREMSHRQKESSSTRNL